MRAATSTKMIFWLSSVLAGTSLIIAMIFSASMGFNGLPRGWLIEIFYPHLVNEAGLISISGEMLQHIKSNTTLVCALALGSALVFYLIAQRQVTRNKTIDD